MQESRECPDGAHVQVSRLVSPVLAKFPWYSGLLTSSQSLLEVSPLSDAFQTFVTSMQGYESTLLDSSQENQNTAIVQKFLGIGSGGQMVSWRPSSTVGASDIGKVCSIISAYRLLDVVAMLNGAPHAPSVPRQYFQVPNKSFRGLEKLDNWCNVLQQFRDMLKKSDRPAESPPKDLSIPFRLLRLIARNNTTQSYTAIEANFLYAAMHIACMKELRFHQDACPDLPDDLGRLVQSQSISASDQHDLNSLLNDLSESLQSHKGVSYMRAPLQLALLISPIFLLIPLQLFKKSYNRNTMLAMSNCLGNAKPQVLFDVEMMIWKALCSLASGMVDPFDVLHQLSDNLPWGRINEVSSTDSARWFDLASVSAPIPHNDLFLEPSAHIETHEPSPTPKNLFLAPLSRIQPDELPSIPLKNLLLEPSAHIETYEPSPTPPRTRHQTPQVFENSPTPPRTRHQTPPVFENSLVSAINLAASTSQASAVDPSLLFSSESSNAPAVIQHSSITADQAMTELGSDSLGESAKASFLRDSAMASMDDSLGESAKASFLPDSAIGSIDDERLAPLVPSLDGPSSDDDDNDNHNAIEEATAENMGTAGSDMDIVPQKVKSQKPRLPSPTRQHINNPRKRKEKPRLPSSRRQHISNPRKRKRRKKENNSKNDSPDDERYSSSNPTDTESDTEPTGIAVHQSVWEPVTFNDLVEHAEEPTGLNSVKAPRFKSDSQIRAFDADGGEHLFTPECHFPDRLKQIGSFFDCIEASNINGKPLHIADPKASMFEIISSDDFAAMSTMEIQSRLRSKNIVVTGVEHPTIQFDKAGLRGLCQMDRSISIQDHSLTDDNGYIPAIVRGLAKDLLNPEGNILNGLDFPMWKDSQWCRRSYATDMMAWDYLLGKVYGGAANTAYPTGHMRWGLVGTAHAVSMLHMDSDGFATFVQVMCGKKLWALYRPDPKLPLSNSNALLDSDFFQLDTIPPDAKSGLEAVILRPGDLLLMRPGVPHFVYGLEDAITHGGHFYSSSLMQATLQSLIHTFVLSDFVSNTYHTPSRQLLRRIVTFWGLGVLGQCVDQEDEEYHHLPDIQTSNGLLDLISGCTLAILANVLDFRTYCAPNLSETTIPSKGQYNLWTNLDRNDIPADERMAIVYTRGVALSVFAWIRKWCIFKNASGQIIHDLPSKYLVHVLCALLQYKSKAYEAQLKGAPHCRPWMLEAQVSNVVECDSSFEQLWCKKQGKPLHTLTMTLGKGECTVEWRDNTPHGQLMSSTAFVQLGLTGLDRAFLKGEQYRHDFEHEASKKLFVLDQLHGRGIFTYKQ